MSVPPELQGLATLLARALPQADATDALPEIQGFLLASHGRSLGTELGQLWRPADDGAGPDQPPPLPAALSSATPAGLRHQLITLLRSKLTAATYLAHKQLKVRGIPLAASPFAPPANCHPCHACCC